MRDLRQVDCLLQGAPQSTETEGAPPRQWAAPCNPPRRKRTDPRTCLRCSDNFVLSLFKAQDADVPVSVKLIRNSGTQPVGYAFLDFSSHEDAKRVLATYNGAPIPGVRGVHFRLNWGSGSKRPTSTALISDSLFVGDLAPEVKDAMLLEHFAKRFPECISAKVVVDPSTVRLACAPRMH